MQRRGEDGAIDSDERVTLLHPVVPSTDAGARELGDRYWSEVTRATLGLVTVRAVRGGSELRMRPLGPGLLRFGPIEVVVDEQGVSCRYPIRGGLLARRAAGALVLSQSNHGGAQLRAAVTGFVPRLTARPYDHIQRRVHVAISRRFFHRLLEERA